MKYTFIALLLIYIFSCSSIPLPKSNDIKSIQDVTIDNIKNAIEKNQIALAMEYLSTFERTANPGNKKQISLLFDEASDLINVLFNEAVSNKDYKESIRISYIAQETGLEINTEWTLNDLLYSLVLSDEFSKTAALKSSITRNFIDLELLENDKLLNLLQLTIDGRDYSLIKKIEDEIKERSLKIDSIYNLQRENFLKTDFLKGTATIWVNRGMKIEAGIGVPDSVIGSGFFIDKEGYLLTNYHVIESEVDPEFEGFSRLYIRLWDNQNTKIPAKVVGWDKVFDIALLKVEVEPEKIFSFSEGKDYFPGTPIIAIGSPGGLENTITSGIVSATGRKFLQMGSVIQVDVPINHGNSGGPLVDGDGELVGVVFAGIEQFEGINFAIPGEYLSKLIPFLYKGGRLAHPYMGLSVQEEKNGLKVIYNTPGFSGARVGLKKGDIITRIMGRNVNKIEDVNKIFLGLEPDMAIRIEWLSNGIIQNGIISLDTRPDYPVLEALEIDLKENLIPAVFGMNINSISDSIFGTDYIITEVFPGSVADIIGLSVNDPFSIKKWQVLEDEKIILMQIKIKKRKAGFLESGVQLGAYMGTPNFI
jgi:serine protease Do